MKRIVDKAFTVQAPLVLTWDRFAKVEKCFGQLGLN